MHFLQTLAVSRSWAQIAFDIVSGIYVQLGSIYNLLIELIDESFISSTALNGITTSIYVLAGIFMLFRIVVSLLQYLIDPDKASDKNVGAGKLISRVIVSLLLLLTLQPFVFPSLAKLQGILLDTDDGLISNLISKVNFNRGISTDIIGSDTNNVSSEGNSVTCYYYSVPKSTANNIFEATFLSSLGTTTKVIFPPINLVGLFTKNDTAVEFGDKFYSITYTRNPSIKSDKYKIDDTSWYLKLNEETYTIQLNEKNDTTNTYTITTSTSTTATSFKNGGSGFSKGVDLLDSGKCPASLTFGYEIDTNTNTFSTIIQNKMSVNKNDIFAANAHLLIQGINGGKNNFNDVWKKYISDIATSNKLIDSIPRDAFLTLTSLLKVQKIEISYSPDNTSFQSFVTKALKAYDTQLSGEGLQFATEVAKTFQTCSDSSIECDSIQDNMFANILGGTEVVDAIKDGNMNFGFILTIVVGLALIVYLVLLMVDVIVRNLKIVVLQMLSPIPIMSYMDPNDKMFNSWLKAYVSAYLDLFLKVFAIYIVIAFLDDEMLGNVITGTSPLIKIFFIFALFTFAKMLPNYLAKLFGIELSAGTFKDTLKGMKTAAMFGGAAIGGTIGGLTGFATGLSAFNASKGQGFGNRALALGNALKNSSKGVTTGMKEGYKGKLLAGASQSAKLNSSRKAAYKDGATAGSIFTASAVGWTGLTKYDKQKDQIDKLTKQNENLKTIQEGTQAIKETVGSGKGTKIGQSGLADLKTMASENKISSLALDIIEKDYIERTRIGKETSFKDLLGKEVVMETIKAPDGQIVGTKIVAIDPKNNDLAAALNELYENGVTDVRLGDNSKQGTVAAIFDKVQNTFESNANESESGFDRVATEADRRTITNFYDLDAISGKSKGIINQNTSAINNIKNDTDFVEATKAREYIEKNKGTN